MEKIDEALKHLRAALAAEIKAEAKAYLKWAIGELHFARQLWDEPNAREHYLTAARGHVMQAQEAR